MPPAHPVEDRTGETLGESVRLPADVAEALRRAGDRPGPFARAVHWYADVTSTNDVAARLAEAGAVEGTIVAADAQSAGRGRLGRQWASPRGAGLYVSIVLRPRPGTVSLLTIAAGVAACEAIRAATGLMPVLKWPNDALIDGRKLAGILAEAGTAEGTLNHVVLGIGINVGHASYPAAISPTATSIEAELGRPVDRGLVFAELLSAWRIRYAGTQAGDAAPIIAAWRQFAAPTLRRQVEWDSSTGVQRGMARDIDDTGALLVDTSSGITRIIAGTVRWV